MQRHNVTGQVRILDGEAQPVRPMVTLAVDSCMSVITITMYSGVVGIVCASLVIHLVVSMASSILRDIRSSQMTL